MGATVAFDDQPTIYEEVHASDSRYVDLGLDGATEHTHHEADQALRSCLRATVQQSPENAKSSGQVCEDRCDSFLVDEAKVPCAVQRRDGVARCLTSAGLGERLDDVRGQTGAVARRRAPVPTHGGAGRWQSAGVGVDLNVQRAATLAHEHAERGE